MADTRTDDCCLESTERQLKHVPRLLLVSSTPPGSGCVGEIYLRDLCRGYPEGQIACFAMTGKRFVPTPDPKLNWLPVRTAARRNERPSRLLPGRLGALTAMVHSWWRLERHVRQLVDEAVRFGREQGADKVWMVLDTVTAFAMGPRIANSLHLPLVSLVWDAPEYLLRTAEIDRFTRKRLLKRFGETLSRSESVAVVSESMAESYHRDYRANCIILRHGLPAEIRRNAACDPTSDTTFVIGFAGGMYAQSAWDSLMEALGRMEWRLGNRRVIVRVVGLGFDFHLRRPGHIEYLGWRETTAETVEILAGCDINYLPQPFESSLADLARYSFPTKLSTYAAAGRPIFVHAPSEASLSAFFECHGMQVCCQSVDPEVVKEQLELLACNSEQYTRAAEAAELVARTEFSDEVTHRRFAQFVGVDGSVLSPL